MVTRADGTIYTFGATPESGGTGTFLTTSISRNSNVITIHYKTIEELTGLPTKGLVLDYLEDTVGRRIDFTYKLLTDNIVRPTNISYCPDFTNTCTASDRIGIDYIYSDYPDSVPRLTEVKPPIGPSYHYDYTFTEAAYRLSTVISPAGGVTSYDWGHFDKPIGSGAIPPFCRHNWQNHNRPRSSQINQNI